MVPDSPRPSRERLYPPPVFTEPTEAAARGGLTSGEELDAATARGFGGVLSIIGVALVVGGLLKGAPGVVGGGVVPLVIAGGLAWRFRRLLRLARLQRRIERRQKRAEFKAREAELLAALEDGRPGAGRVSLAGPWVLCSQNSARGG